MAAVKENHGGMIVLTLWAHLTKMWTSSGDSAHLYAHETIGFVFSDTTKLRVAKNAKHAT